LHVDRDLTFAELAVVLTGEPLEGVLLEREVARLRKRFERVKRQLRKWASEDGLFAP
jgi:hypothetical protein